MKITCITAFPEFLRAFLQTSIVGRAVRTGVLDTAVLDLRDFADGVWRQVDDYAFGGGGMVLMAEPLARAVEAAHERGRAFVVGTTPQGVPLTQELVESLASREHLAVVCGHYEGMDERFVRKFVDLEVSIGDYVLTGGELPAMVMIDAVSRRVPGVVGRETAVEEDSFFRGFLDHVSYTRPAVWRGESVPEPLLGGAHAVVAELRRDESVRRTLERRPDLLSRASLIPYLSCGAYLCVAENAGLEQVASVGAFYDIKRCCVVAPEAGRSASAEEDASGSSAEAMSGVKRFRTRGNMLRWIEKKEKAAPLVVAVPQERCEGALHWLECKRRLLEERRPVLFLFGGDAPQRGDLVLLPPECMAAERRLPGEAAVAVVLDRFFGWR